MYDWNYFSFLRTDNKENKSNISVIIKIMSQVIDFVDRTFLRNNFFIVLC